ncbi:MAG: hypothetical protein WBV31_12340 [Terriglobales bacterium]
MPMLIPLDAVVTLRQVNENLRAALLRLRPERTRCSSITPHDFSGILRQLLRAAECLRRPSANSDAAAALQQQALEYRGNLEKLRRFLPDVHLRLLAEKARLETARARLATAAEWAQARKTTL